MTPIAGLPLVGSQLPKWYPLVPAPSIACSSLIAVVVVPPANPTVQLFAIVVPFTVAVAFTVFIVNV